MTSVPRRCCGPAHDSSREQAAREAKQKGPLVRARTSSMAHKAQVAGIPSYSLELAAVLAHRYSTFFVQRPAFLEFSQNLSMPALGQLIHRHKTNADGDNHPVEWAGHE
jgi:hypothetical protein